MAHFMLFKLSYYRMPIEAIFYEYNFKKHNQRKLFKIPGYIQKKGLLREYYPNKVSTPFRLLLKTR